MAKVTEADPAQLAFPSYIEELVPEQSYTDIDPDSRLTLMSLIDHIKPDIQFGRPLSFRDYEHSERSYIEKGLYIEPTNAAMSGKNTKHVLTLGCRDDEAKERNQPSAEKRNLAVSFQPVEFKIAARSPSDLARHAVVKAEASRWAGADRKKDKDSSIRAGGRSLESKIDSQKRLAAELQDVRHLSGALIEHLVQPSKHRLKAHKLDKQRTTAVEKIHDTAELAGITLDLSNRDMAGLHRAIKRHIYSGNYSHAERTHFLIEYLKMIGIHSRAKIYKLSVAHRRCLAELIDYQPYLDAELARQNKASETAKTT